ncbi:MAG: hypothetical protein F9K19_10510 [Rhizobiaceae bacterium]|nr:MAG: hypothetical protein F9K19_10510 [Rhizobiaceae bacterium]
MAELLRPLSAKSMARRRRVMAVDEAAITEWKLPPDEGRMPLLEERQAGRIGDRAWAGLAWFAAATGRPTDALRQDNESLELSTGGRRSEDTGITQSFLCRDPLALWPAEAAADHALRIGRSVSRLGQLRHVIERAIAGAEMRELAPTGSFAKANIAAAGRLRLLAALEICALLAEEEHGGPLAAGAITTVLANLAESVSRIAATRRMRVANDNIPLRRAA